MREISLRYAKALYKISSEANQEDLILLELRSLESLFKEAEVQEFFKSSLVKNTEKEEVLRVSLKDKGVSENIYNFIMTLVRKRRMALFSEVALAFQDQIDEVNGVNRGFVKSFKPLSSEERTRIQEVVSKATQKKVILTYSEDASLIGSLVAKVGSYTFNDTLSSHLERLKDNLNRRAY